MYARRPSIRLTGSTLMARVELVAEDGPDLPALEVVLPRREVNRLDPTATPALPFLAAVAAARGETVTVEGSADAAAAAAADAVARRLAQRWGRGPAGVEVEERHDAPPVPDGEVGLLFDRSVASWAALIDSHRGTRPSGEGPDPATLLVSVVPAGPPSATGAIRADHQVAADDCGLELLEVITTAPAVLDAVGAPPEAVVLGRVSAALVAGAELAHLVVPGPMGAELAAATLAVPRLAAARHLSAVEEVALVAGDSVARVTFRPCTDPDEDDNCGRCVPCLLVQSALVLVGDSRPAFGFTTPLSLAAVRFAPVTDAHGELVSALVEGLPPAHEALRRAWADAWDERHGLPTRARWGLDGPPGMAGPDLAQRVAAALRATTGGPEAPVPAPLGWRPGAVYLRPALADHEAIWAAAAAGPGRPRAWLVVEPHVREGRRDGDQALLALRAEDVLGPGAAYLPGILWADDQEPVLDRGAVARLLLTARARLWWRPGGDLDPLRLVETIEHGCLPLQVMPDGAAAELAEALPAPLAPLIVAESALAEVDLTAPVVAAILAPAVDFLLAGSAEHGLLVGAYGD